MATDDPTASPVQPRLLRLAPGDNVAVLTARGDAGEEVVLDGADSVRLLDSAGVGHKIAVRKITSGNKVIKFGCPIGSATRDIRIGEHVHTHNLKSDYLPTFTLDDGRKFLKE